jgi:hypothetical protein
MARREGKVFICTSRNRALINTLAQLHKATVFNIFSNIQTLIFWSCQRCLLQAVRAPELALHHDLALALRKLQ